MTEVTRSLEDLKKARIAVLEAAHIEAQSGLADIAAAQGKLGVATAADALALGTGEKSVSAYERAAGHFSNYAEYNKLLRSWFVAFGIGGIALFLVSPMC
jgi:hypothetical protein